ncbi:MAG: hypothetical protein LBB73_08920 [Dysgonamonadaceae bacterium]|nr:hypothetical protein [Dysgonamonadaceae bacterium]
MTTVYINEKTDAGKRILREVAENPQIGKVNDNPAGYTVEEVFAGVDVKLSEAYGIDFAKIMQMLNSGEIKESELTDELLLSSLFQYKLHPEFEPRSSSRDIKPDMAASLIH